MKKLIKKRYKQSEIIHKAKKTIKAIMRTIENPLQKLQQIMKKKTPVTSIQNTQKQIEIN